MASIRKTCLLWAAIVQALGSQLLGTSLVAGVNSTYIFDYFNDEDKSETDRNTTMSNRNNDQYNIMRKIVSRSGYFLRIGPDGRVSGTSNCRDVYVYVTTFVVGPNLLIIRGTETGLYLAMNENGKVSARNNTESRILSQQNVDMLWREKFKPRSCFVSFQSYRAVQNRSTGLGEKSTGPRKRTNGERSIERDRFLSITKGGRVTTSTSDTQFKSNFFLISYKSQN
ncbi:putative fibroblast growth factor 1 [Anneissia japonica]|uniref:putative fibroblast growth factor 1 n=1 Tax=Anneissia japonica TaxID=1529436 RepID=UPI00142567CE|nr:putative fibroblast growth factor 1 [Anneissia japonica]XP_033103031.1 putative fibroblast growth factor 1 [Anneissia japonica]